jgi:hypothetical protein
VDVGDSAREKVAWTVLRRAKIDALQQFSLKEPAATGTFVETRPTLFGLLETGVHSPTHASTALTLV